ncbi:NO-inducible flavohemoprotein [Paraburkholderia gardini]|uniref:nitric oxide dioxygenase n=1 Tax=Paraburkholderia gardini TaxID=2823469 RepID=A0ABM8U0H0_9BURK|nr:NO-inducible flavohemoprotein [Paraburkholderia gardini]CAG4892320.1 Flavohemoprotein [Paraburkholderia gardini]
MTQLTPTQMKKVKSTAPVLAEHGVTITKHFYRRLFTHHPELRNVFNQTNQKNGNQAETLAHAVWAYAAHIDNIDALGPAVAHIANKHVSLNIAPAQYDIVGEHLLASIVEVLGDAVDAETVDAWSAAYAQLAGLMIGVERKLYDLADWEGFRPFTVVRKVHESDEISSFYLEPVDGRSPGRFKPGQYVSVKRYIDVLGYEQPRQYSLSDAPNSNYLRISVKREPGNIETTPGVISNVLHDGVNVGALLEVSAPAGVFALDTTKHTPVVLVSGGVGITPMISMLSFLVQDRNDRRIVFAHACRNGRVHAFKDWVNECATRRRMLSKHVYYEAVGEDDIPGTDYDATGRIDLSSLVDEELIAGADFYVCGPLPFMIEQKETLGRLGVEAARVHTEIFGSGMLG